MRVVTATVAWFTKVSVNVGDTASDDEVREALISTAEMQFDSLKNRPAIHECSDENLVD